MKENQANTLRSHAVVKTIRPKDLMTTAFLVISAPGAFEIEMKHSYFKPAISAPCSLMTKNVL